MSKYDDGYLRAQRAYDAQTPDEDEYDVCPHCDGEKTINSSNCCGMPIYDSTDICTRCKEHCEPEKCPTCEGEGEVNMTRVKAERRLEAEEHKADIERDGF